MSKLSSRTAIFKSPSTLLITSHVTGYFLWSQTKKFLIKVRWSNPVNSLLVNGSAFIASGIVKDLEIAIDSSLKFNHHILNIVKESNSLDSLILRAFSSIDIFLLWSISTFARVLITLIWLKTFKDPSIISEGNMLDNLWTPNYMQKVGALDLDARVASHTLDLYIVFEDLISPLMNSSDYLSWMTAFV